MLYVVCSALKKVEMLIRFILSMTNKRRQLDASIFRGGRFMLVTIEVANGRQQKISEGLIK